MNKFLGIAGLFTVLMLNANSPVFAQEEEVKVRNANEQPEPVEKGFKKQNLFICILRIGVFNFFQETHLHREMLMVRRRPFFLYFFRMLLEIVYIS